MPRVTLGFRTHTGWAAAVALAGPPASPEVIDRWRLGLRDWGMPLQAYHAARPLGRREAAELIERAVEAAGIMAEQALRTVTGDLRAAGHEIVGSGVILGSGWSTSSLAAALSSHAGAHGAEGQMYRQAIIQASGACGLPVTGIAERDLYTRGPAALAIPVDELRQRLSELGRPLGPPWGQDQKSAALVAWLALAGRSTQGG